MCKDSFVFLKFESDRHKIARTFENVYFLKEKNKKKKQPKEKGKRKS